MSGTAKTQIIIAALEPEIAALVRGWRVVELPLPQAKFGSGGTRRKPYKLYLSPDAERPAIALAGGIGARAARSATQAAIDYCADHSRNGAGLVISAGLAGALEATLKVGDIVIPHTIIDEADGLRIECASPLSRGILLTSSSVASAALKRDFATRHGALAVDMEAYAVADVAQIHGLPFLAVKAISDERDVELPPLNRFIRADGSFSTAGVAMYAALRPQTWSRFIALGKHSALATERLTARLRELISGGSALPVSRKNHAGDGYNRSSAPAENRD